MYMLFQPQHIAAIKKNSGTSMPSALWSRNVATQRCLAMLKAQVLLKDSHNQAACCPADSRQSETIQLKGGGKWWPDSFVDQSRSTSQLDAPR